MPANSPPGQHGVSAGSSHLSNHPPDSSIGLLPQTNDPEVPVVPKAALQPVGTIFIVPKSIIISCPPWSVEQTSNVG